jgi:uncharacterized membrane protein SirB2
MGSGIIGAPMGYLVFKYLHIFCAAASFALLFVRGFWILSVYPPAPERWVRVLPHVVDGLLILSAVAMLTIGPRLGWPAWLQVKLLLVLVYLGLAGFVFRLGSNRLQKGFGWLLVLVVFLYITTVAVIKHPLGILSVV